MTSTTTQTTRELDRRESDGIEVRLLWQPSDDAVLLHVDDHRLAIRFIVPVPAERARHAFLHPFAYAGDAAGHDVDALLDQDLAVPPPSRSRRWGRARIR